jgi:hypothetical protein
MLSRFRRDPLELYRHKDGGLLGVVKPRDSGLDGGDPSGSQC